jgi:predicted P-loop ATPase
MEAEMPRLDKTQLTVSSLDEFTEEKQYWLSRGKADRLNAIEINRRMVYGTDRTTSRLQRFLETAELTRS